jgi:AmmeMemoRadiSam system protein B
MKRSVTEFSASEIEEELKKAHARNGGMNDAIRLIFAPSRIDEENLSRAASVYSRLRPNGYDTVIVVEELGEVLGKKLQMPSNNAYKTPLGEVLVNDNLRNEFCDEDDDFFIDDSGFHPDLSLFQQLMMLQKSLRDFDVLNIQIADEGQYIIKELVSAMDELLPSRRVLLIFCCDLQVTDRQKFEEIKSFVEAKSHSGLFNLLNRNTSVMKGAAAFTAGILVAHRWQLQIRFLDDVQETPGLIAYAEREHVFY